MKLLLDCKYAPLTFSWGFIEAPIEKIMDVWVPWSKVNFKNVETFVLRESFPLILKHLEPLTIPRHLELLVITNSSWVAYFDNGANGGDPESIIGYLCQVLRCRGVAVTSIPNTKKGSGRTATGTYGAVQFILFAPEEREFLNYERTILAANDGGKWVFRATGTELNFERTEQYRMRKIQDRFTSEMLEEYCLSLGIDLFNSDFYGPGGFLLKINNPLPPNHPNLSLIEAQRKLGLIK